MKYIMEAHNALSAKIVEETGFSGIWASGLTMSAALGFRDSNEASWTQVLDVLDRMTDNVNIPIIVDADTGYGNFNNARLFAKKIHQIGIAGMCIEDKLFPKTNSFLDGQKLANINEFCGKIRAIKDTVPIQVIARVEAYIAGVGEQAIERAEAYRQAGADAILIHSKKTDQSEIREFLSEWKNRHPVVIVPTTYPADGLDVDTIIWANHNLRSSINAMRKTSKELFKGKQPTNIASVQDIFELQNISELKEAEKKYETF